MFVDLRQISCKSHDTSSTGTALNTGNMLLSSGLTEETEYQHILEGRWYVWICFQWLQWCFKWFPFVHHIFGALERHLLRGKIDRKKTRNKVVLRDKIVGERHLLHIYYSNSPYTSIMELMHEAVNFISSSLFVFFYSVKCHYMWFKKLFIICAWLL